MSVNALAVIGFVLSAGALLAGWLGLLPDWIAAPIGLALLLSYFTLVERRRW